MNSHFVKKNHCPACLHLLDAATATTGKRAPKPLDFSVCAYCGTLLRLDAQMESQTATDADWSFLTPANRVTVEKIQQAIRAMKKQPTVSVKG